MLGRRNIRPPHFASKVSYSAGAEYTGYGAGAENAEYGAGAANGVSPKTRLQATSLCTQFC